MASSNGLWFSTRRIFGGSPAFRRFVLSNARETREAITPESRALIRSAATGSSVAVNGRAYFSRPCSPKTVEQGRYIYKVLCASCHGDRGQGVGDYPALSGGQGTLKSNNPVLTVGSYWPYATTVWDYTHRAMPYQRPGTLSVDETYALTAFLLYMNGIVDQKAELNEKSLPQIKMPNRDGFVPDPRPDVPSRQSMKCTRNILVVLNQRRQI
jgi:hypothetical protein